MIRVTVYNEFLHEKTDDNVKAIYPEGIHNALKEHLTDDEITVKTVTLDNVEDITDELLGNTDVLIWWGHIAHDKVPDEVAKRVQNAVLSGRPAPVRSRGQVLPGQSRYLHRSAHCNYFCPHTIQHTSNAA